MKPDEPSPLLLPDGPGKFLFPVPPPPDPEAGLGKKEGGQVNKRTVQEDAYGIECGQEFLSVSFFLECLQRI